MKILFISDIVAKPGRETVKKILPGVLEEYGPDIVIANGENLAHGKGFSPDHIAEMREVGIDFFTAGNHVWGNSTGAEMLDDPDFPVIRPANYPQKGVPGRGYDIVTDKEGRRLLVINLIGRVFMRNCPDCPFRAADKILEKFANEDLAGIFVDFHAETTSEKYALKFYLDGRVSAIMGTHTHVPTSDAGVSEAGTAFMADVGMVGSLDSVIGVKKEIIIEHFLTQMPVKHEPETEGKMVLNAALVTLDEKSRKALNVLHVQKFI
ncbi:MAG: TIGR00282 family metallophosphoesterase [Candidatus Peregrinibacteria bacterium]